jgi:hypothetical protein
MSECGIPELEPAFPTEPVSIGSGPALIYRHSDGHTFTFADRDPVREGGPLSVDDAHRERRLCRALLIHALSLLDGENES